MQLGPRIRCRVDGRAEGRPHVLVDVGEAEILRHGDAQAAPAEAECAEIVGSSGWDS